MINVDWVATSIQRYKANRKVARIVSYFEKVMFSQVAEIVNKYYTPWSTFT